MITFESARVLVGRSLAEFDQFHTGMTKLVAELPLPRAEMVERLEATTTHLDSALTALSGARLQPGSQAAVSQAYDGLRGMRQSIGVVLEHPQIDLAAIKWDAAFDSVYSELGEAAIAVA